MKNPSEGNEKLTTQEEVVALMRSSQTEEDWNDNCDRVKADFGGYPDFWYAAIVSSGIAQQTADAYGVSSGIQITAIQQSPLSEFVVNKFGELRAVSGISGRPTKMPNLKPGVKLICKYDQGLGDKFFVCNTVEGMQQIYDSYAQGMVLRISWHEADMASSTGKEIGDVIA